MTGPLKKYAFINAKIRARISKLLSEDFLNLMIKAKSIDEALALLGETPFAVIEEIYSKTGDLKLGELELLKNEIKVYADIKKFVHNEIADFIQALLTRYEIDNLKNAIRLFFDRKIRGRNIDIAAHYILYDKIVHNIDIDAIVNAENFGEIARALAATPYSEIIEEFRDRVELDNSLFRMEIALDQYYYKYLITQAENMSKKDRNDALRLIGVEIDLQNINWIIRFKNVYNLSINEALSYIIPQGFNLGIQSIKEVYSAQNMTQILQETVRKKYSGVSTILSSFQISDSSSRLQLIERILEHIMKREIVRMLTGYPFAIGILLSYFILKRNEINKIKTVLNAKQYNFSEERIEGII